MKIIIKRTILLTIFTLCATFAYCLSASAANTAQVVTVKSIVERGSIVNKSNLKLVPYNNKNIPSSIITNIDDAAGLETMRTIRPGMHLRFSFLREKPLVVKNKPATITYKAPGLSLESEVLVLQDGYKGDFVKIKNLKSNKILTAEVIGDNLVKIK